MAASADNASMALFCDFENIALGVRDAQYEKFDIRPVLERLLAKGNIVVKKAYCDWDRYKTFKAAMHEANFELIEIPHVRQSGKNSADIRMVVDALDLCYTKAHVDTFVIISGDSDFSPLVSKLRENAKKVIGVGVKQSCSDLLVTNCDEFIYYDDLVRDREAQRAPQRREREKRTPEEEAKRREKQEERKAKAVSIVSATFADLIADRGESERIWASVLKEVVKRRNPGFNENYYGFRTFGNLLEEAANRGLLGFGRDDKGAFVFRAPARPNGVEGDGVQNTVPVEVQDNGEMPASTVDVVVGAETGEPVAVETPVVAESAKANGRRRNGRRGRRGDETTAALEAAPQSVIAPEVVESPVVVESAEPVAPVAEAVVSEAAVAEKPTKATAKTPRSRSNTRRPARKKAAEGESTVTPVEREAASEPVAAVVVAEAPVSDLPASEAKPKPARRPSRPRKPKAAPAES